MLRGRRQERSRLRCARHFLRDTLVERYSALPASRADRITCGQFPQVFVLLLYSSEALASSVPPEG